MEYQCSAETKLMVIRERPCMRYMVTTLGGFFPVIHKLPDGRLGVIARDGDFHVGLRGRLILVTSKDGGESWGMPIVVAGEGPDDRNPAFGVAPDGTLLVAFIKADHYVNGQFIPLGRRKGKMKPLLFVTRSLGGGSTWSKPEQIPMPPGYYSPYGKMVNLSDGTILMALYGRPVVDEDLHLAERDTAYLLRSRDNGQTWGDLTALSPEGLNETALLPLSSGRLLAVLRSDGQRVPANGLWRSVSDDGGYTWDSLRQVTGQDEHPADLILLQSGRILMTYGYRNPPFGVRALLSGDGGETWDYDHAVVLVDEGATRDLGYPSSVQLDDGRIVTAYYAYESFGPFRYLERQNMGIHAAVVKYDERDLLG